MNAQLYLSTFVTAQSRAGTSLNILYTLKAFLNLQSSQNKCLFVLKFRVVVLKTTACAHRNCHFIHLHFPLDRSGQTMHFGSDLLRTSSTKCHSCRLPTDKGGDHFCGVCTRSPMGHCTTAIYPCTMD